MSATSQLVLKRLLVPVAFACALAIASFAHAHEGEDHGGVPASVEGDAIVETADYFASGKSETRFFIKDNNGKRRELQLPTGMAAPQVITGDKIKAKGHIHSKRPDAILLDEPVAAIGVIGTTGTSGTAAALSGTRKAIAIITDFGDSNVACTDSTVAATLFAAAPTKSVDAYYQETSKGVLNVTGDVVRVKISSNIGSTCDYNNWASAASTEAAKQVSLSSYSHRIYVLPANVACGWAGLGTIGGGSTWVNTCSNGRVYAHELGHNFAMWHAGANGGNEYGDNTDVMGSAYIPVNAPHSAQLGWTPSANVLNVNQSGTYRLTSLETMPNAAITPQVIKVLKEDTNETYYLSLRSQTGLFGASLSTNYAGKLNVHRWGSESHTRFHGAYGVDQPFSDTLNGITVTPIAVNGDTLDIRVDISAICRQSPPSISVSNPGNVAPGASGTAYVSITNNDSAYCPATRFTLSSVMNQAGVTSTTSVPDITIPARSSGSFNVFLQTTSTTLVGTYTGVVSANDAANSRVLSGNLSVNVSTTTTKGRGRRSR